MITRGRLLDRMRVALAGSASARLVLGEDTNFAVADLKRVRKMAERYVFYYGMSDFGITSWAQQPYSHDFAVGSNRPRKVRWAGVSAHARARGRAGEWAHAAAAARRERARACAAVCVV